MQYPYYYDQNTGAPSGHFSDPTARANIRNPITPYGIAYTPPERPTSEYEQSVQEPQRQRPSRLRRAAGFLKDVAVLGTLGYMLYDQGKQRDRDNEVTPVEVRDVTPVRDRVQNLLKGVADTRDIDVDGNPIKPGPYESAPRLGPFTPPQDRRQAGGDYFKTVAKEAFRKAGGMYTGDFDDEGEPIEAKGNEDKNFGYGTPSALAEISVADPEEVGGIRSAKSENMRRKFRKNIFTTEGRPQTEHPGLDEEIVGISPEQEARREKWVNSPLAVKSKPKKVDERGFYTDDYYQDSDSYQLDRDRFFDHPDVDDHAGADETPNVDAGQQHLANYTNGEVEKVLFDEFGDDWPQILEERRKWNRSYTGPEVAGTGTLTYPIEEGGSEAVTRAELTPDMVLKAQFIEKPTDDPATWRESPVGYKWNLATGDGLNEGDRNAGITQLGEFIADRMPGTQQGKESMGGLINVVEDETRQEPNKLYKFAQMKKIEGDPSLAEKQREYGEISNRRTKAMNERRKELKKELGAVVPDHGRGQRDSAFLAKGTKFDMSEWDEQQDLPERSDTSVRLARGYDKAKRRGLIPDSAADDSTPTRKTRYTYPLQGNMSTEKYFDQNAFKIAKLAVDNPDFDSEAYYDNKRKWIQDQMD